LETSLLDFAVFDILDHKEGLYSIKHKSLLTVFMKFNKFSSFHRNFVIVVLEVSVTKKLKNCCPK